MGFGFDGWLVGGSVRDENKASGPRAYSSLCGRVASDLSSLRGV